MTAPGTSKDGSDDKPAPSAGHGGPHRGSSRPSVREGTALVALEQASAHSNNRQMGSRKHSDGASKASRTIPLVSAPKESPTAHTTLSPGSDSKGSPGKQQPTSDTAGSKGSVPKNGASRRSAGAASPAKAPSEERVSKPQEVPEQPCPEERRQKLKLKMPDGTYVGPQDRNRYIRQGRAHDAMKQKQNGLMRLRGIL
ncbi:uncharacterized protein LOC144108600 [Amblyomma americanum]